MTAETTQAHAVNALRTMYRYRAMCRKFASLYKDDDPEMSRMYAKLARLGTTKIREAEASGVVNLAELCGMALHETAAGERAALEEYFATA